MAWKEFLNGKRKRKDVRTFEIKLADNIFDLRDSLKFGTYKHGSYLAFTVHDPKRRNIHKASVRDRLLHRAIYRKLYPPYDKIFIADSYSCRDNKGIHKALGRFKKFYWKVSKNNRRTAWVLKCDIRKFFDSIDHQILVSILSKKIADQNILLLLEKIIASFEKTSGRGIPLGNLTSQLFANIYMHEFDQFVKQTLKIKYYIRYADDFVFLSQSKPELENFLPKIKKFLENELELDLHPNKVFIKTFSSGVDFLGWVNFPHHRVLRTVTKRRMLKKLAKPSNGSFARSAKGGFRENNTKPETIQSYLGLLGHGNTYKIQNLIL